MKLTHALGCLDIDRVLGRYLLGCITCDETEKLNVLVEVFERELVLRVGIEIVKPDAGEVGDNNIAGKIAFGYAFKVFQRLFVRSIEVLAEGLVLGYKRAAPEE